MSSSGVDLPVSELDGDGKNGAMCLGECGELEVGLVLSGVPL